MQRIGITTDCVCDLPEDLLRRCGVDLMHFYITTDSGRFRDGYAITSGNILEYLEDGGTKAETSAPAPEEYVEFFENHLQKYSEIVHIGISDRVGHSCANAIKAVSLMGDNARRVTVINSRHLSTGMGHMVLKAVELRDAGCSAAEIAEAIERMRSKVSTTFITCNADYLYRNGQVSQTVKKLCAFFKLHPILEMRNGRITLHSFRIGNYEKSVIRYIRSALSSSGSIDHRRLFITHAGCSVKMIAQIRAEVERLYQFDEIIVTKASATVSGNCGPWTVGVLFVHQ